MALRISFRQTSFTRFRGIYSIAAATFWWAQKPSWKGKASGFTGGERVAYACAHVALFSSRSALDPKDDVEVTVSPWDVAAKDT